MFKILVLSLFLFQCALGQELLHKHAIDIDGDGTAEYVGLREYEVDGVFYGRLIVADEKGRDLWVGPNTNREFRFLGEFDGGTLEAAYQTSDGQVFLLASYQKSDVRPTKFRLFTWHNRGFVHLRDGSLLPTSKPADKFVWSDKPQASRWIEAFNGADGEGNLKAQFTDMRAGRQSKILLRPKGKEYVLKVSD